MTPPEAGEPGTTAGARRILAGLDVALPIGDNGDPEPDMARPPRAPCYPMTIRSYPTTTILLCLLAPGLAWGQGETRAGQPIGLYDLRWASRFDPHDPGEVRAAWDHCHALATLQGVVNRTAPRLYLRFVSFGGTDLDTYWLERYRAPGRWLHGRAVTSYRDIEAVVAAYRTFVRGVVLYDPAVPATSNVASAICGAEDLIAIRYDPSPGSLYRRLVTGGPRLAIRRRLLRSDGTSLFEDSGTIPGTELPSTGSAKCDAYLWLKHHYLDRGRCDGRYGAYYIDACWMENPQATVPNHHTLTNHDFFVARRAFFFDLSPWGDEAPSDDPGQAPGTDLRVLGELLSSAYHQLGGKEIIHIGGFPPWAFKYTRHAGGRHEDVPTEWEYARIISAYNAFQDADAIGLGAMANGSFWAHFPLEKEYPQGWVTREELREKGYLERDGRVRFDGREFVILYVGDYDSASWVYQRIPDIWDHPDRGKVPLMWCVSPVLDRRVPMALDYLRESATTNDYFAAADNGAGYLNPGMLQEPRPISDLPGGLDAWGRHCSTYYRRWGLTITGFVIDGYAPALNEAGLSCYARFSPNGIVPQKVPPAMLHNDMPVLRADRDVNQNDPAVAARVIADRVRARSLPFHWFRNILKSPGWYVRLHAELKKLDSRITLVSAPVFFELLRIYLETEYEAPPPNPRNL